MHGSKAKSGIYSVLPISRLMSSYFLGSSSSEHVAVLWKTNAITTNGHPCACPPCPITLNFYCWALMLCGMEYPSCEFGSTIPAVSPPNILLSVNIWHWENTAQQEPKYCCVINTISVTMAKHNIIQAGVGRVNSSTTRPGTQQKEECRAVSNLQILPLFLIFENVLNLHILCKKP